MATPSHSRRTPPKQDIPASGSFFGEVSKFTREPGTTPIEVHVNERDVRHARHILETLGSVSLTDLNGQGLSDVQSAAMLEYLIRTGAVAETATPFRGQIDPRNTGFALNTQRHYIPEPGAAHDSRSSTTAPTWDLWIDEE